MESSNASVAELGYIAKDRSYGRNSYHPYVPDGIMGFTTTTTVKELSTVEM